LGFLEPAAAAALLDLFVLSARFLLGSAKSLMYENSKCWYLK
jgi:hypothetical protein